MEDDKVQNLLVLKINSHIQQRIWNFFFFLKMHLISVIFAIIVYSLFWVYVYSRPQYSGGSNGSFGFGGDKYLPPSMPTLKPIITKQFYLHSAPPDNGDEHRTKHLIIGRPQKNYRVVFIKAPSADNSNVRLTAEYAPQEEKTVIYLLSQKEQSLDINNIVVTPSPTKPSKPEVFFIKYKTAEEAVAAQKEIQEQYDHIGGSSEFFDQGTLPVASVIGSLDGGAANGGYNYKQIQGGASSPVSEYLPPSV